MTSTPRRMRSRTVLLGVTALAASSLSGCASSEPDYAAICTDPQTQQRVSDDQCDDSDTPRDYTPGASGFFWFYLLTRGSSPLPAIGRSYAPRAGTYDGGRLAASGRSVQRGGLPRSGAPSVKSFTRSGGFGGSRGVSSS